MVALVLAGAVLIGGVAGGMLRRRTGRVGRPARRSLDDPSVAAHAGFTNQGPQA